MPGTFYGDKWAVPSKSALCIDGHLCRGQGSRCGSAADFSSLAGQAALALHTLGLEKVWVACRCEAQMKEAERLLCPAAAQTSASIWPARKSLPGGMALDAETKWFGTIYFCAQNPISPPLKAAVFCPRGSAPKFFNQVPNRRRKNT